MVFTLRKNACCYLPSGTDLQDVNKLVLVLALDVVLHMNTGKNELLSLNYRICKKCCFRYVREHRFKGHGVAVRAFDKRVLVAVDHRELEQECKINIECVAFVVELFMLALQKRESRKHRHQPRRPGKLRNRRQRSAAICPEQRVGLVCLDKRDQVVFDRPLVEYLNWRVPGHLDHISRIIDINTVSANKFNQALLDRLCELSPLGIAEIYDFTLREPAAAGLVISRTREAGADNY